MAHHKPCETCKRRIPDTTDGPKRIGYYLEPLKGIASNPDRQRILKDFSRKPMYNILNFTIMFFKQSTK